MFAIIGVSGIICLTVAAYQIWMGHLSNQWQEVRGVIQENKSSSHEDIPSSIRGYGIGNTPSYAFSVRYDYVFNGSRFTGSRIHYGMRNLNKKAELLAYLAEFNVGHEVVVFIDPQKPARSVLVPGVSAASIGLFSLGLAITIIGSAVYYYIQS